MNIRDEILDNKYKNVVIFSGAGVSTNSGIPDYRSKNGVFARLAQSNDFPDAKMPEDFFSRWFYDEHPEFKDHPIVKELHKKIKNAKPTPSHKFAKWLNDRGVLRRVITQNVDGLYQKTGLPNDKIIEFHGNYLDDTIVLYGDDINKDNVLQSYDDMRYVDLIIVMGSSLQVHPFCDIPKVANRNCKRLLIDREPDTIYCKGYERIKSDVDEWSRGIMK